MNEENVSRVRHLEPLHQLPFDVLDHQDVISNEIINEISKNDKDAFLPVNVDECVGRERKLLKGDEERVDRLPPIPGVLSQSMQAPPQLNKKLNAVLVHLLKARHRFHEYVLSIRVNESSSHV